MKIVQINSYCGYGSTGRIVVDISKKLNENNYENYIFYGVGKSSYENSIKFGGTFNLRGHQIKTRLLGKHGFYSKNVTNKMIEKLKKINPDIVHLHNLHGHYLNVEILFNYLKAYNKKVIWTLHDCWSFTGHCAHFEYIGCDKWKTECNNCPQLNEYPRSWIFDRSKESYIDKKKLFTGLNNLIFITPSTWLKDKLSQSFLGDYKAITINNGIDLNIFKPISSIDIRKKYKLEDKYVILAVASVWSSQKGLNDLIKLSEMIDNNKVIMVVGVSKEQKRILTENMIGIERTENIEELANIYSTADVFVNTTYQDTFPTVNIEALACGTPVITYNSGGSPEIIDENTGVVVEKSDLLALHKAISNMKRKDNYQDYCISKASFFYNKENSYSKYIDIYQDIILNVGKGN